MEALRRRVGELDLGNALVREVADAFAASKGRYGCRGIKAALRTGVSEKVTERIMAEDGLVAHVPGRRRYGSYEGETTPAPGNLIARDFTAERPNEKRLTDIAEVKAADGKVYLLPVIGCHDGKIVAYAAGCGPDARLADTMLEKSAATLSEGARPLVRSDRGRHHGCPGWPELMVTARAGGIDGREGLFAGQRGRGGFLRRDEGRVRLPRAVGGAHPWEGARVDRRVHPLVQLRSR